MLNYEEIGEAFIKALRKTNRVSIDDLKLYLDKDVWGDLPTTQTIKFTHHLPASFLDPGYSLTNAFYFTGLVKSKSEARRLISQGSMFVNDQPVTDIQATLTPDDLSGSEILLRVGKGENVSLLFSGTVMQGLVCESCDWQGDAPQSDVEDSSWDTSCPNCGDTLVFLGCPRLTSFESK